MTAVSSKVGRFYFSGSGSKRQKEKTHALRGVKSARLSSSFLISNLRWRSLSDSHGIITAQISRMRRSHNIHRGEEI